MCTYLDGNDICVIFQKLQLNEESVTFYICFLPCLIGLDIGKQTVFMFSVSLINMHMHVYGLCMFMDYMCYDLI
jgi:hypothetical protein